MVTPPDIEAQILRYYHVEKWRVGTIAGQLHVHHSVLESAEFSVTFLRRVTCAHSCRATVR